MSPMSVELVRVTTSDGVRLDGAWQAASTKRPPQSLDTDTVLCVHGTGSNFYASTLMESLAQQMHQLGLGVLRINTRGHDLISTAATESGGRRAGAAYEIVDDCRHDLAAWIEWLVQQGAQRIVLLGHSLGALKSIYFLAHQPHASVARLIAISPPRLSHAHFVASSAGDEFSRALAQAKGALERGAGDELMEIRVPLPYVITAAGYVDKYGPGERYNILNLIDRVNVPSLFVYGGQELQTNFAFSGMAEEIPRASTREPHPAVSVIAGADHFYTLARTELAHRVASWLRKAVA